MRINTLPTQQPAAYKHTHREEKTGDNAHSGVVHDQEHDVSVGQRVHNRVVLDGGAKLAWLLKKTKTKNPPTASIPGGQNAGGGVRAWRGRVEYAPLSQIQN